MGYLIQTIVFAILITYTIAQQKAFYKGHTCPQRDLDRTGCRGPTDCLYPNSNDCTRYIQCNSGGVAYDMPCPEGLHYSTRSKACDFPHLAACRSDSSLFKCPRYDILRTQCERQRDCLYAHPTNCNEYIECEVNHDHRTGRPSVRHCPSGLEWNDNDKRCDAIERSTCPLRHTKDRDVVRYDPDDSSAGDDPPIPGYKCPPEDLRKGCDEPTSCVYQNDKDCATYIRCTTGGYAYLRPCSPGLLWNNIKKVCDWPEQTTCHQ
ncbi:unnamed protein product [Medioppia subpectinata]|uniref:Chitin-binding type-2 domain-containing protein n=1 Tax=Medioppia subpectinata TaxID=1979941 RepID=A0A7R9L111_9ACAR|nr:unnamed protein product [Medioppia subpectinata]CAG2113601.1 unnamed protein product [Medioppia subpectinata]